MRIYARKVFFNFGFVDSRSTYYCPAFLAKDLENQCQLPSAKLRLRWFHEKQLSSGTEYKIACIKAFLFNNKSDLFCML